MLVRTPEDGLLDTLQQYGVGCIAFSPLAQGLLSNKYLQGIPENSRAAKDFSLKQDSITDETILKIQALNSIAENRGQSLAQMAIAWLLKDERVTSVLIGARNEMQLLDSLKSLDHLTFSPIELSEIEKILG